MVFILGTAVAGAPAAKAGQKGLAHLGAGAEHGAIRQSSSFSFRDQGFFSKRLNMGGK